MSTQSDYKARQILQFACQNNKTTFIIKNKKEVLFEGPGEKLIKNNPYEYLCKIKNTKVINNKVELLIGD